MSSNAVSFADTLASPVVRRREHSVQHVEVLWDSLECLLWDKRRTLLSNKRAPCVGEKCARTLRPNVGCLLTTSPQESQCTLKDEKLNVSCIPSLTFWSKSFTSHRHGCSAERWCKGCQRAPHAFVGDALRILTVLAHPTQYFKEPIDRLANYLSRDPTFLKELDVALHLSPSSQLARRINRFKAAMMDIAKAKVLLGDLHINFVRRLDISAISTLLVASNPLQSSETCHSASCSKS